MTLLRSNYQRASIKASVICALFGLLVAALIWGILGVGLHEIIVNPWFRWPIAVGVIVLFLAAISFGLVAGNLIYRFGLSTYRPAVIGIILAWVCLTISALAAVSVNFVSEIGSAHAFNDYLLRPAGGIIVIGLIPALLLGLVYSVLVRSDLTNT